MGSRAPADERIVLYNSLASCGLSRAEYPMHVCRLWKGCCVGDEEEEEEGWWSVLLLEGSCSFSSFLLPLLFHVSSLLSPCLGAARPNGHLRYALCPLPSALCPLPSAPCPAALLPCCPLNKHTVQSGSFWKSRWHSSKTVVSYLVRPACATHVGVVCHIPW